MALTDKLTAIGNAIRAKDGSTALLTLDEMPIAIAAIETPSTPGGGDGGIPEEALVLTGDCSDKFKNDNWTWFINQYGSKMSTKDITKLYYTFAVCKTLESLPFEINLKANTKNIDMTATFRGCELLPKITLNVPETSSLDRMDNLFTDCKNLKEINDFSANHTTTYKNMGYLFSNCNSLERVPYIYNAYPESIGSLFTDCWKLKSIPADYFDTWNFSRVNTYAYSQGGNIFNGCRSLRAIPKEIMSKFAKETVTKSTSNTFYYGCFYGCYVMDEIADIPVSTSTNTSNMFNMCFGNNYRVKNITFETNEDGTAKAAQWKGQTIDLSSSSIGYWNPLYINQNAVTDCGISWDKVIGRADEYEARKNDVDATPYDIKFSRYNHDSAVNTLNSLPDTSAYLATAGGTNTIKFKKDSGSATDGGAINTLTAEEIAVATAKGWTVSFI